MTQNFTQNDILLYLYGELDKQLIPSIQKAISENEELRNFYTHSLQTLNELDEIKENPSVSVINILNEESRSSSLEMH
jgi:hypothetical protein